jgi:hypothetical protein
MPVCCFSDVDTCLRIEMYMHLGQTDVDTSCLNVRKFVFFSMWVYVYISVCMYVCVCVCARSRPLSRSNAKRHGEVLLCMYVCMYVCMYCGLENN